MPKPCSKCGLLNELCKNRPECKLCRKVYLDSYKAKNSERLRVYARDYYKRNKTKRQRQMKAALERDHESFISHLISHVRRKQMKRKDCKKCGSTTLHPGRLVCTDCHRAEHRESYRRDKEKRAAATKAAISRSPESFLQDLVRHGSKNRSGNIKTSSVANIFEIDFDYLWSIYQEQAGRCAISKLPLDHCWGKMTSMSIDRIDSSFGYVRDNVQLVCSAINMMKGKHSQADAISFIDAMQNELYPQTDT